MTNENELINILMHMFSHPSLKDNNNSLLFSLCFRNSRSFFLDFTAFFHELFVCRGIRIRQSRKLLLLESEILGYGVQNTAQGIRNPKAKLTDKESGI